MFTCVYLSLLKLTRDYPCTCDIRAFIASCSPSCESVTYSLFLYIHTCIHTYIRCDYENQEAVLY